ncbi:MAG: hypothetical protein QF437_15305 [Planctomycetota bacterium]|jgi:hypothetical protein|nr:hypothetical protein [Planctomycetota bacterium]MDP7131863.1 hypothetical protein [Planctomycetota bacterium]
MSKPSTELTRYNLENLSEEDLLFVIKAYADRRTDHENIRELIDGDQDIIELMVESDRVFQRLMDRGTIVQSISPYFFFSLLLRRTSKDLINQPELMEEQLVEVNQQERAIPWTSERAQKLLADDCITDYLANMISVFLRSSRMFKVNESDEQSFYYLVDLIEDCQKSDPVRRFRIYCHIGNYTLFLTGLFPEFIEHRHRYRRRPVDEHFYMDFGKTYYGLASDHRLARNQELDGVFHQLSTGYEVVKTFLNFTASRYLRKSCA